MPEGFPKPPPMEGVQSSDGKITISKEEISRSEEMRKYRAQENDLAEGASWEEIEEREKILLRSKTALMLGLPEDASREQVLAASAERFEQEGARMYLPLIDLDYNASNEEIEEALYKLDMYKFFRLLKVGFEILSKAPTKERAERPPRYRVLERVIRDTYEDGDKLEEILECNGIRHRHCMDIVSYDANGEVTFADEHFKEDLGPCDGKHS